MMNRSDGAAAAERDFVVDGEGNVCRTVGYMTDCLNEDTDKVPLQTHPLREFEQHLNDLKKENFSLKLRIYFLEERIQQKFEDGSDEIYRTNIELKVEVESLKQELQEKQQLLDKALYEELGRERLRVQQEMQVCVFLCGSSLVSSTDQTHQAFRSITGG
ncbi:CDK5 regulatory subunit-associated protein 2-like [Sinocyclocheilus anshuiensis]|uniref:CDK5 regulatory subunit-associated protein 2-like n=1 Tax=Sinocyclocheilus anshuiensis TaxID=1608454 RepID=UPI0007B882E8|nr:PREDICTED: CDK5 regulatory subunit-associated protein 2-like [Sinocyclocheilus anshuiensis]